MPGLRPTPNRVRETLFNWLIPVLPGARCLDLFAGTGALGFESLSRGADRVTFVEQDRDLVQQLMHTRNNLKATSADVLQQDAISFLSSTTEKYDVIFLDPPFNQGLTEQACDEILKCSVLQDNGLLYLETELNGSIPEYLKQHKQKTAGQVQYGLFQIDDTNL